MFQVGDTVVYGTTGVCTVEGLTEKEIARVKKQYYVLRPISQSNSAVYVPADNEALLSKVRRILSPEEIGEVIRSALPEAREWPENDVTRREMFSAVLAKGDRKELLLMVRAIYRHQKELAAQGKRLHVADERLMKEANRLISEEICVSLNIEPDEVEAYIAARIDAAEAE